VTSCSCTLPGLYWSSSSYADDPNNAWDVDFSLGNANTFPKELHHSVRAVRGGL